VRSSRRHLRGADVQSRCGSGEGPHCLGTVQSRFTTLFFESLTVPVMFALRWPSLPSVGGQSTVCVIGLVDPLAPVEGHPRLKEAARLYRLICQLSVADEARSCSRRHYDQHSLMLHIDDAEDMTA